MEQARLNLERLCRERGVDYFSLSKMLNRNAAYIQQFIKRGTPRKLDEEDRRTLAEFFGVTEDVLGGRNSPALKQATTRGKGATLVSVPQLAIGASAGTGSLVEDSASVTQFGFGEKWLKEISTNADMVSMIQVDGDSMAPTLMNGDDILVDRSATHHLRDGIYVLRFEDSLMVKRIALNPVAKLVSVRSDNPTYPDWEDVSPDRVHIIGRVIWVGRKV